MIILTVRKQIQQENRVSDQACLTLAKLPLAGQAVRLQPGVQDLPDLGSGPGSSDRGFLPGHRDLVLRAGGQRQDLEQHQLRPQPSDQGHRLEQRGEEEVGQKEGVHHG